MGTGLACAPELVPPARDKGEKVLLIEPPSAADPDAGDYALPSEPVDGLHVDLQQGGHLGDLRELRLPEGSFDLVTLWNALDFAPDPLELLREVHRVLKGGGQLFIRTPNATWQLLSARAVGLVRRLGWGGMLEAPADVAFIFHATSFSRSTLRRLLERAGFVPLGIRNSPPVTGDLGATRLRG